MHKNLIVYLVIGLFFLSSCAEEEKEIIKEDSYKILVQVNYTDFFEQLNGYHIDPELKSLISDCENEVGKTGGDFWKLLQDRLMKDSTGLNLFSLIKYSPDKRDYMKMDNSSFVNKLKDEFHMIFERSMVVVESRLEKFGDTYPEIIRKGDNVFEITVYNIKNKERLGRIISSYVNMGFFETMENVTSYNEILRLTKIVHERDSIAGISVDDSYLFGVNNSYVPKGFIYNLIVSNGQYSIPDGAQIGRMQIKDTSYFNQFTRDTILKSYLPSRVHFLWGMKEDHDGYLPLFTILSRNLREPDFSSEYITDARVEELNGALQVVVTLSMDGAEKIAKLTRKNIGKAIAIILDGKVISAPIVNGDISGGTMVISGEFTSEEADELTNILKAGTMPIRLRILDIRSIN